MKLRLMNKLFTSNSEEMERGGEEPTVVAWVCDGSIGREWGVGGGMKVTPTAHEPLSAVWARAAARESLAPSA